jgi:hypothetical protein
LRVHVNLFCVVAGCVSRSVAVRLNKGLCSKLARNTTFFQNTSVALTDFQAQSDPFWCPWHYKKACPIHSCLETKSLFRSLLSRHEVWAWSFSTPCKRSEKNTWTVSTLSRSPGCSCLLQDMFLYVLSSFHGRYWFGCSLHSMSSVAYQWTPSRICSIMQIVHDRHSLTHLHSGFMQAM